MPQNNAHNPRTPPAPTTTPTGGRTAHQPPIPAQNKPMYGVVEYRNGFGHRFVAVDATEAQAVALCAEARRLGMRPADTTHFLTESITH